MRMRIMAVVAVFLVSRAAAGQDFLLNWQKHLPSGDYACWWNSFDIPQLGDPRYARVAIAARPGPELRVSFDADFDGKWNWDSYNDSTVSRDGHLEMTYRFPSGPARRAAINVCDETRTPLTFTAKAHFVRQARIPHNSDRMQHDDELYRHLIFDNYDQPGPTVDQQSWVLPSMAPKFFIQLAGEDGVCGRSARVSLLAMHYWRAIVPILAEQLTGVPYPHRVEADCVPREPRRGWVTVKHVTPNEYFETTGNPWGDAAGRASVGHTTGKIWIKHNGHPAQPTDQYKDLIAHEIGHVFGLNHTGRAGAVMNTRNRAKPNTFHVFTPAEERAARAAYRIGRGARYCGNPDTCGNGAAPGESLSLDHLWPRIAVD